MSTADDLAAMEAQEEAIQAKILALRQQMQDQAQAALDALGPLEEKVETGLEDDLKKLFNTDPPSWAHKFLAVQIGQLRLLQKIEENTRKTVETPAP